jgi:CHAT domain-containing protein
MKSPSQHIDPETLAAFAEGRLDAAKRDAVVAHIDHCHDCMNDVALVMSAATAESQRRRFGRPSWLLAVAAALALALPLAWHAMRHGSATDELVSLSPRSARIVEPRLTGFPWAAYHGPMRAAGGSVIDAERLKLGGAAGDLMQRAEHDSSAEAQHAAGVAMVLVDKPDEAIAKLESAAKASHDAKSWSDLAAARYAAAVQFRRPSLYPEALAASDDALRIDARLPEALFNRALILENMGLISEARKAWQRYLEVDPGSQWSNEARTHLNELPSTTGAARWERDQPLLEAAAASGDAGKTLALVDTYRERARTFAEAEYLGRWAAAVQRADESDATHWLAISRAIGISLSRLSGESLLRDAVAVIDHAEPSSRTTIAAAHSAYRDGRLAFSRHEVEAGERDLRRAAALFDETGDPMALMARHYAASARLARNDFSAARTELQDLCNHADTHPTYLALGAHVRGELAHACRADDDWPAQVPTLIAAVELFRRGGEHASEAFAQSVLASALTFLGRADEAWSARVSAFNTLSRESLADLLETSVAEAVHSETRAGRTEAALALSDVEQALQRPETRRVVVAVTLVQKAMLESVTGRPADAAMSTLRARQIAAMLPDPELRAVQNANIDVAIGARLLSTDPHAANASLTKAIDYFRAHGQTTSLPEPLLLRARSAAQLGQVAVAQSDLEDGMNAIERQPLNVEGVTLGTGVLDAANELFADAIRLRLNSGDVATAFAYAGRWHGEELTLAAFQKRLGKSDALVLVTIALPDELVTFAVTSSDASVVRQQLSLADLDSFTARAAAGDDGGAARLYDLIVRPASRTLARATSLIIIPDRRLAAIPFPALYDSIARQYLVEQLPVAIAASAASLSNGGQTTASHVLAAIMLPAGHSVGSPELPDAEKEFPDISGHYAHASVLAAEHATWAGVCAAAASADVIHIGGHTEQQPDGYDEALLFASPDGKRERVSWRTIASAPFLHPRVIVLAACETLRAPVSAQNRVLSLGAAFSLGGADVIGTLTSIPDRDARALFGIVHRELAAGATAAGALRTAQLESIRNSIEGGGTRAWRALAVLTRHIR